MHLSPVKGAYPHKDQHDRTAPVFVDDKGLNKNIERGEVIRITEDALGNAAFTIATDASVFPMYLALQRFDDLQAAMAGQYSPSNGDKDDHPFGYAPGAWKKAAGGKYSNATPAGGVRPAISGIHMDDGDVWETDMFDEEANWDSAKLNDKLTVKDGRITCTGATDDNCVGFLVKRPYKRYCNDAPAVDGMMTGATRYVIQFQCGK